MCCALGKNFLDEKGYQSVVNVFELSSNYTESTKGMQFTSKEMDSSFR